MSRAKLRKKRKKCKRLRNYFSYIQCYLHRLLLTLHPNLRQLSFNVEYCSIIANNGYHSFATNFVLHKNAIYPKNLMKVHEMLDNKTKIIICEIPKGSKYAKNEFDEYISEKLIYIEDY